MEKINDGGPAFPVPEQIGQQRDPVSTEWLQGWEPVQHGMTLRDYFAAAALQGLLASGVAAERGQTSEEIAAIAFKNADAMLAEREKSK